MSQPDLSAAARTLIDETLSDIFASDSPAAITEAVRRLMAVLTQLDPRLPVGDPANDEPVR